MATALRLLDLPRTVGADPESGEPITAQNGRYGPYIKKGTDSRSLTSEDQIFEVDLPAALEIFAQPKYGARRASSALKEFDADPVSGKPIR
ncbi:topoisomerase C-terminal repeat-containing protein, partial [Rathayibacter iranicus]|uniref:topoisomerase C-terminal repeat-containing protein n=1 Tax=Rathayibacter iranicus TaxID=59737 RepID=UPI001F4DF4DD